MAGVLLFKGMKAGFKSGDVSISVNEAGEITSTAILSTAYNVVPIWIKIASDNLKAVKIASEEISIIWSEDGDVQRQLLIAELAPAMQVIVSCGIAIDGLYDTLRPYAHLSDAEIQKWRENRTARYKQVVEIIRRIYKPNNQVVSDLSKSIKYFFELRDKAVHPSQKLEHACQKVGVPVGVDWRFSAYSYDNAKACFTNTINIIAFLFDSKTGRQEVDAEVTNIVEALVELRIISVNVPTGAV